jgi:hypothetical protein
VAREWDAEEGRGGEGEGEGEGCLVSLEEEGAGLFGFVDGWCSDVL